MIQFQLVLRKTELQKLILGTGKMLVPDDAGVSTISASAISTGVKAGASVSSG
jgi:hypothetical protein